MNDSTSYAPPSAVRELFDAPPPRHVPKELWKFSVRLSRGPLILCAFLGPIGSVFLGVGYAAYRGLVPSDGLAGPAFMAFGTLMIANALVFLVLALGFRRRRRVLLERGEVVRGRIESVRSTGTVVGSARLHQARIRAELDGREIRTLSPLAGKSVSIARQLAEAGHEVRVLVQPGEPGRGLLEVAVDPLGDAPYSKASSRSKPRIRIIAPAVGGFVGFVAGVAILLVSINLDEPAPLWAIFLPPALGAIGAAPFLPRLFASARDWRQQHTRRTSRAE